MPQKRKDIQEDEEDDEEDEEEAIFQKQDWLCCTEEIVVFTPVHPREATYVPFQPALLSRWFSLSQGGIWIPSLKFHWVNQTVGVCQDDDAESSGTEIAALAKWKPLEQLKKTLGCLG